MQYTLIKNILNLLYVESKMRFQLLTDLFLISYAYSLITIAISLIYHGGHLRMVSKS